MIAVVTRPEKPSGRGLRPRPTPAAAHCSGWGIPVLQPARMSDSLRGELSSLEPDLLLSAAYGAYLPAPLLELCSLGVVNVHPSLLPLHRGAAPVQRAIQQGYERTGVCFMLTDEGWDTGPILTCFPTPIRSDDTAGSLEARLAEIAAGNVEEVLVAYASGRLRPHGQEGEPTYAGKIEVDETYVNWSRPAVVIDRCVRAFNPRPGARTRVGGKLLKIWAVGLAEGGSPVPGHPPGTLVPVSEDRVEVCCGEVGGETIALLEVQPEGGRSMTCAEYLRGHRPEPGVRLGD